MSSVARLLLAGRTRGFVGSSATRMVGHAGSNAAQPAPRVFKRPFSFGNRPITEIRVRAQLRYSGTADRQVLEYAALEQTYLSWIMLGLGIVGGSLILDSLASNQASAELIAVHVADGERRNRTLEHYCRRSIATWGSGRDPSASSTPRAVTSQGSAAFTAASFARPASRQSV